MRWFVGRMVDGFAWMLGASAGQDAYRELRDEAERELDEIEARKPPVDPVAEARERKKRLEAEAKARGKAKKKLEREIDADLKALKKRVARGG